MSRSQSARCWLRSYIAPARPSLRVRTFRRHTNFSRQTKQSFHEWSRTDSFSPLQCLLMRRIGTKSMVLVRKPLVHMQRCSHHRSLLETPKKRVDSNFILHTLFCTTLRWTAICFSSTRQFSTLARRQLVTTHDGEQRQHAVVSR